MRIYYEFAKKRFLVNMAYRFEYFTGILNTGLQVVVYWFIYRALYGNKTVFDGITFSMLITNFILAFIISNAFYLDDFFLQQKIRDGSIANEYLRPVNLKGRIFAENLGETAFLIVFQGIPALLISKWIFGIESPKDTKSLLLFIMSLVLGYLIIWNISFIVQVSSFWILNVWSISTIKNVFIDVLAGVYLPLWFMPKTIQNIIKLTPFDSIFFTPIQFYFGRVETSEIIFLFLRQIIWIFILYAIGQVLWVRGNKKVIVQGG